MANVHKHPVRGLRGIDTELTEEFDQAARDAGSDRSTVTRALWAWYVGRAGAQLPKRPAPRARTEPSGQPGTPDEPQDPATH